jgi:hypothetical protein
MAAAGTDVRQWLREQGHTVGSRGQISPALLDEYRAAHPGADPAAGPAPADGDYPPVTDADFPPPASDQGAKHEPGAGEQRPRTVRPSASRRGGGGPGRFTDRIFRRESPDGKKKPRPRHARVDLGDFAEETWLDLAWLAQPIPPLAKVFTIQAPYAGVVLDEQVKGTIVDAALQPVARYSGVYRALNGLLGPPVCVLAICAQGKRDPATGELDLPTQMMFGMLKYSLLQMAKVSDLKADEISQRTEDMAGRMAVVDQIIRDLFPPPPPPGAERETDRENGDVSRESSPYQGGHGGPGENMPPMSGVVVPRGMRAAGDGWPFGYPGPPPMTDVGADPGRA